MSQNMNQRGQEGVPKIRITPDGDVYVGNKLIGLRGHNETRLTIYARLKRFARIDVEDVVFDTPYELIKHLTHDFHLSDAIDFVSYLLARAGTLRDDIEMLKQLVTPTRSVPVPTKHTLVPDVLMDAYARLNDTLETLSQIDGIYEYFDADNNIVGRSVVFPLLTWYGFVRCEGKVEEVADLVFVVSCNDRDVVLYRIPLNAMSFLNTLNFVKSLDISITNDFQAKIANALPEIPTHLLVSNEELEAIEFFPPNPPTSYFAHLFSDACGKSFVAPIVMKDGIKWVETRVRGVRTVEYGEYRNLRGSSLTYKHGDYRGRVVLLPWYSSDEYHRAVVEFMERNRDTELMRSVEKNAERLADRLNKLTDFLTTIASTIKQNM